MNDRPLRTESLEVLEAGGDVLVHDPVRRKIHVLNQTAAKVLQACDGKTSVVEIAERIAPHSASKAASDIATIVEEFRRLGLLSA